MEKEQKNAKVTILVIDDNEEIIDLLESLLTKHGYNVLAAKEGEAGLEAAKKKEPDLILLDVNLPKVDGREICKILKSGKETKKIPVIMLTGKKDTKVLEECYDSGTDDFLNKPFENIELLSRVKSMLRLKESEARVSRDNKYLESKIEEKTSRLKDTYMQTIKSLVKVLEAKDRYNPLHSERVAQIASEIGVKMNLSESDILYLKEAAELRDIGKVAIPDGILSKKGKLTNEEGEEIRKHPVISYNILKALTFLNGTLDTIMQHHERFDGKGYPGGKKGKEIPLAARILAVADAYEAMTNERPYRKALTKDEAIKELTANAGKQFDPEITKIFVEILEKRR